MAAVGLRSGTSKRVENWGQVFVVIAPLDAVSDTNTFDTGLDSIIDGGVFVCHESADAVAADSIAVASISGGEVTFQVAGTARTANLMAFGYK